jgi:hypothetical protein
LSNPGIAKFFESGHFASFAVPFLRSRAAPRFVKQLADDKIWFGKSKCRVANFPAVCSNGFRYRRKWIPGYTDTQPFPAASVKWTYKATYRLDDKQVGLWSQTTSVTVPA